MTGQAQLLLDDAWRQCERHLHQEPYEDRPMVDKLLRLEKLGYLPSVEVWNKLRSIRNHFAHDYPQDDALKAAYLNEAVSAVPQLEQLMAQIKPLVNAD